MTITFAQFYHLSPSDVEIISVDYTDVLSSTEELTGTPSVTAIAPNSTHLTFSNIALSSTVTVILGREVATAKAMSFKVIGQQLTYSYRARVSVTTTSSPARTLLRDLTFDCV